MTSDNLTKEFIVRRIKTQEDLQTLVKSFSYEDRPFKEQLEYIKKQEYLSITLLKRVFGINYAQAKEIIAKMVENKAIEQSEDKYFVLSYTKVLNTLKTLKITDIN